MAAITLAMFSLVQICSADRAFKPVCTDPGAGRGCAHPSVYSSSGGGGSSFSIFGVDRISDRAEVTWQSIGGCLYTLQCKVEATGNDWSNVPPHIAEIGVDGFVTGPDKVGDVEQKLYRLWNLD